MPNDNTIYDWYQSTKQRKAELEELGLRPPSPPPTTAKENAYTETYSFTLSKTLKQRLRMLTHQSGFRFMSETIRALIAQGFGGGSTTDTQKRKKSTERATVEEQVFLEASFTFRKVLTTWGKKGGIKEDLKEFQVQWDDPSYDADELEQKAKAIESVLIKKGVSGG